MRVVRAGGGVRLSAGGREVRGGCEVVGVGARLGGVVLSIDLGRLCCGVRWGRRVGAGRAVVAVRGPILVVMAESTVGGPVKLVPDVAGRLVGWDTVVVVVTVVDAVGGVAVVGVVMDPSSSSSDVNTGVVVSLGFIASSTIERKVSKRIGLTLNLAFSRLQATASAVSGFPVVWVSSSDMRELIRFSKCSRMVQRMAWAQFSMMWRMFVLQDPRVSRGGLMQSPALSNMVITVCGMVFQLLSW